MTNTVSPKWGDLVQTADGKLVKWFTPNQQQQEILASSARFLLALGGINSGKTSIGCLWLLNEIEKYKGRGVYMIMAPTFGVVLSSTLDAWKKTIAGTPYADHFVNQSANPHYLLSTGGKVYFKSADANVEGVKPYAILLDEGGNVPEECFNKVCRRLDGCGGRLCITTTPYLNYNWIPNVIIGEANKGNGQYFYRFLKSADNPTQDRQAIEEAKRRLSDWEYKLFYEGQYSKPPGIVYEWGNAFSLMPTTGLPKALAYYGAIDYGGTDPFAVLLAFLDETDCLWVFHELYTVCDIDEFFTKLARLNDQLKAQGISVTRWFADHRPECNRALKRRLGLPIKPVKKGPESIPLGIDLVRARLRTGRLKIISNACPNLLKEGATYRYQMSEGVAIGNKPLKGQPDHALDALRYLVMSVDRKHAKRLSGNYDA